MWMKDVEPPHEEPVEDVLDFIQKSDERLALGLYSQLKFQKDHFSNMQNRYRGLTSTWLLAAFAGIGFLITCYIQLPFSVLLGILLLCVCSIFGITLLWFLDVVLYQRFWIATVLELAKLENAHSWLPRTNANTLVIRKSKKYRTFQSYFYIGINAVFIIISTIVCLDYISANIISGSVVVSIGIITFLIIAYYMLKYSGEKEKIN